VERPRLAWRQMTLMNVFDSLIYLPESVKVSIPLRAHLTQAKVTAVLSMYSPIAFLCDYLVKA
jgi:hypothetical protein